MSTGIFWIFRVDIFPENIFENDPGHFHPSQANYKPPDQAINASAALRSSSEICFYSLEFSWEVSSKIELVVALNY